jgi:hypothetical protein
MKKLTIESINNFCDSGQLNYFGDCYRKFTISDEPVNINSKRVYIKKSKVKMCDIYDENGPGVVQDAGYVRFSFGNSYPRHLCLSNNRTFDKIINKLSPEKAEKKNSNWNNTYIVYITPQKTTKF